MAATNYVFSPIVTNDDEIPPILEKSHDQCYHVSPSGDKIYKMDSSTGRVNIEKFKRPHELDDLVDEGGMQYQNEETFLQWMDSVKKNRNNYKPFLNLLPLSNVQSIGRDNERITTKLVKGLPIVMCVSNICASNYFDLVAITENDVLAYNNTELNQINKYLNHSGDITGEEKYNTDMEYNEQPLLQALVYNGKSYEENIIDRGTLVFHCYNHKTFRQLAAAKPSVCLVNGDENLVFISCPMTGADNAHTRMMFVAYYEINHETMCVNWFVPCNPFPSSNKFNVCDVCDLRYRSTDAYKHISQWVKSVDNLNHGACSHYEQPVATKSVSYSKRTHKQLGIEISHENKKQKGNTASVRDTPKLVLVMQKPVLAIAGVLSCFLPRLQNECLTENAYGFHHRIEKININTLITKANNGEICLDRGQQRHEWWSEAEGGCSSLLQSFASLPLASGDVIVGGKCLCLGLAPSTKEDAAAMADDLENCSGLIVVLAETPNKLNAKPTKRLNATFIVVTDKKKLDDVNVANVYNLQSTCARILIYTTHNNELYYYTGPESNLSFGDTVPMCDLPALIRTFPVPRKVPADLVRVGKRIPLYNSDGSVAATVDVDVHNVYRTTETILDTILDVCGNDKQQATRLCRQLANILTNSNVTNIQREIIERRKQHTTQSYTWNDAITALGVYNIDRNEEVLSLMRKICETNMSFGLEFETRQLVARCFYYLERNNKNNAYVRNVCMYLHHQAYKFRGQRVAMYEHLYAQMGLLVCSRSSYGQRKIDLAKAMKADTIKGNVNMVKLMTVQDLEDLLQKEERDAGIGEDRSRGSLCAIMLSIDLTHLDGLATKFVPGQRKWQMFNVDGSPNQQTSSIITIRTNLQMDNSFAVYMLPEATQDKPMALITEIDNKNIVMVPSLAQAKLVMATMDSVLTHPFDKVNPGSPIAIIRMMFRQTMFDLLSAECKEEMDIKTPGDPQVGHATVKFLLNVLNLLPASSSSADSTLCECARSVAFLAISVMASGAINPLSHAHRLLFYPGTKVQSNFDVEYAVVLLNNWNKLWCDGSKNEKTMEKVLVENVINRLQGLAQSVKDSSRNKCENKRKRPEVVVDRVLLHACVSLTLADTIPFVAEDLAALQNHFITPRDCNDEESAEKHINAFLQTYPDAVQDVLSGPKQPEPIQAAVEPNSDTLTCLKQDIIKVCGIWKRLLTLYPVIHDISSLKSKNMTCTRPQLSAQFLRIKLALGEDDNDDVVSAAFDAFVKKDGLPGCKTLQHSLDVIRHDCVRYLLKHMGPFEKVTQYLNEYYCSSESDKKILVGKILVANVARRIMMLPYRIARLPIGLVQKVIKNDYAASTQLHIVSRRTTKQDVTITQEAALQEKKSQARFQQCITNSPTFAHIVNECCSCRLLVDKINVF